MMESTRYGIEQHIGLKLSSFAGCGVSGIALGYPGHIDTRAFICSKKRFSFYEFLLLVITDI
jgi:hypothetical protein